MSGATKSGIMAVNANTYRPIIDNVKALAAKYEPVVATFKGFMDKPGGTYWEGQTATAGQANAKSGWNASARLTDIGEKLERDAGPIIDHTIVPNLTNAQHIIDNASKWEGVTVNENLKMTYTPPEGMSKEMADKNAKTVEAASEELQECGRKWYEGVQQVKALGEGAMREIHNEVNSAAGTFDVNKTVKDTAPRTTDPNATTVNYKEMYPKATDPASTQAAAATATDPHAPVLGPPSPGDKPPVDPSKLGGLTGNLGVMGITEPKSPLDKPPAPPDARTVPAPKLDPNTPQGKAAIDKFRSILATQYPPDQVEAKLSDAIKGAQQDRPMVATPEPGIPERVRQSGGEAFAESWDQAGRAKDDLLGINGGDHAKEAWKGVAKGLWDVVNPDPVHQVERGIDRAEGAIDEVKSGIDNPKAFIGKHGIEIAAGIATAPVGGEGALLGTEGRALTHGLEDAAPGHHSPTHVEHPGPTAGDHTPTISDHTPGADSSSHTGGHIGTGDSTPVAGRDYGFAPNDVFKNWSSPADEIARLEQGGVPSHVTNGYDQWAGRSPEQYAHEFTVPGRDGSPRWDWEHQAPNNGFAGPPTITDRIPQGHLLDRLGSEGGAFMADDGAPLGTRGMPAGVPSQYNQYVGTGNPIPPGLPWEIHHGPAAPAFGQPGGAPQWVVINRNTGKQIPVEVLKQNGIIE
ncbi:TNT domain-containing protein [Mycobacteroides abscessus subsp. abscessus]|uniref:TNT domain-containing protein n=1 Tax=Mycobacteroides abscessus TaxID=36809 RepID=UPI00092585C6|nr:TNT domain-containing protein [Mycobacteroides abscessus]AWG47985.1 DUF4237 domain-containing protein [Mycobacteroides abscessus]MBN7551583.1 TNT domain-containing protein [Mycobacteroides abscessus subsp. abscessus]MDM2172356.1 TNT domain-containing protein [Mycobacteroides abscessus]MDM2178992.1 TNT domain-containing protein [Mycobacteroides abscessus]MDM2208507.1 TNT domain-containing protein [Mycobacteroides abscessus]